MSGVLLSIFGFILMIGLLVFIHELGHFLVAKWFGVRVESFSIGFVGSLVSFRWGETEYRIGWLPLGGYVRMLGEGEGENVPEDLLKRSFAHKPLWQRSLIVLAGPIANLFVLPIIALVVIFGSQTKELSTVIGTLVPGRPAEQAGLRPGDEIVSVDGVRTRYFRDLLHTVGRSAGRQITLRIKRDNRELTFKITPYTHEQSDFFGKLIKRGAIGVITAHRMPEVGISDPNSPAYRAGLRTWDLITAIDGKPIRRWQQVLEHRAKDPKQPHRYTFQRLLRYHDPVMEHQVRLPAQTVLITPIQRGKEWYDGIHSSELFVQSVRPGTPVFTAGIRTGDRLIRFANRTLRVHSDFTTLPEIDPNSKKTSTYKISFEREGKIITRDLALKPVVWVDPINQRHERIISGAELRAPYAQGVEVPIHNRFQYALSRSISGTWERIGVITQAIGKLFTREIPTETIGGPIMIFQIAKKAVKSGWEVFLLQMVLISINLGLLNLLPIPILDGGHLVFFLVEGVTRKPIPAKVKHWFLLTGFVLLLLLMVIAFHNDLRRVLF